MLAFFLIAKIEKNRCEENYFIFAQFLNKIHNEKSYNFYPYFNAF
jgi:hypothetical protein